MKRPRIFSDVFTETQYSVNNAKTIENSSEDSDGVFTPIGSTAMKNVEESDSESLSDSSEEEDVQEVDEKFTTLKMLLS